MRALTWNLFHGRDAPPEPGLHSWRSRLLRVTERGAAYAQVNRPLLAEFAGVLAAEAWQLLLLQELPPRWTGTLARRCGAEPASVLTSRNSFGRLRGLLADLNPDLIASNEGGSNAILVRPPWRIAEQRTLTLTRRPERRRMVWARLRAGAAELAVADVHLSKAPAAAAAEALAAAEAAVAWAGGTPLVLGGDLNLAPARSPEPFRLLADRHGLAPPTPGEAIDHLLAPGLDVVDAPAALPPGWRELPEPDPPPGARPLLVRLSDHDAVAATFALPGRTDGPLPPTG